MVDIIKLPSNRPFFEQITVPILYSNVHRTPQNEYLNTKQWIGRCPGDPPRHVNISDLPSLHRNVINRELLRCYSTTVDTSASMKIKPAPQQQRNSNKEPLKVTTVTSNSILSNVDETDSHLFDALSKHFTIKAEPLRPVSNFLNNSTNTVSSWQKYWASTQTQRQRQETDDSELPFSRRKRNQSSITTPHFVTVRNLSSLANLENNIPSSTKPSSTFVSDKQEDQSFLPPLCSHTSSMNSFKSFEDKSLETIKSEHTVTNDDDKNEINSLTTKMYRLPLPSSRPKTTKSILKTRSRSKSLERKAMIPSRLIERKETKPTPLLANTPVPKRKNRTPSNKSHRSISKKQQQSLLTVITTTPRSKYEPLKWDEPYIGVRYDPPTPPSSPSYFPWSQINDQNENEIPYKLNSIDEIYL
jgi:hypothetical protein